MPIKDSEARKKYNRIYRLKHLAEYMKRDRKYRQANPEKLLRRNRRYRKNNPEKVRAWVRKACKKWRKKHGSAYYKKYAKKKGENIKHTARVLLHTAVKEGRIIRPKKCSKCGKRCKPHGHHPNYSKPLKVVWLCGLCHKQEHLPVS